MRYLQMWLVVPLVLLVSSPAAAQYARRPYVGGYSAYQQPPAAYGQPPMLSEAPPLPDTAYSIDDAGTPIGDAGIQIDDAGIPIGDAGIPIDQSGVPVDDAGYPLVDNGMGQMGMNPGCGDEVGGCGDGSCGGESCGTCRQRRGGRMAGWLNRACQCAAVRPYILPIGRRDCYGCPTLNCGPYGDGTSAVHWFDVSAEFVYLKREDISPVVGFASDGIGGPIVLSSDSVGFDEAPGARVTGTWQVGASSHLEAVYMGGFNWHQSAWVSSANDNLYSALSDFGRVPAGGFLQSDQAETQFIDYSSDLHNVELNWRQHWVGSHYWLQGSFLMGVRYLRLREDLMYQTLVDAHVDPLSGLDRGPANMHYRVNTTNHVVGFQLGGDLFASLLPGLLMGGNLKAGIYGNDARQRSTVVATNLNPDLLESDRSGDAAFVAEGGLTFIYQVHPWLSLRGGYEMLYVNGVALAPENFNTQAPFVGTRSVAVNNEGDVFYHGLTAGLEWLW